MVLEKKEEYAKSTLIDSQSKWTLFSKDILNIAKELQSTLNALQIQRTINKVPIEPIQDKLGRYESFLMHNSEEIQRKHGINMMKPTFIENYQNQMHGGGMPMQMSMPHMMGPHPFIGTDNSFEQEVEPIQRVLENRFHPMEGVLPPPGMQALGSEGFSGMQQVPLPPLNPGNPTMQLMQMQEELAPLDFNKIKKFLVESTEEIRVCASLQALRWRLTKTKRKQLVKLVILTYAHYDLLDCKKAATLAANG